MDKNRIEYLYRGHLANSLTAKELIEWEHSLLLPDQEHLIEMINADWNNLQIQDHLNLKENRAQEILNSIIDPTKKQVSIWPRLLIAAAALAIIVFGVLLFQPLNRQERHQQSTAQNMDISPGRSGATITLANGKRIALSEAKNGVLIGKDLRYDDNTLLTALSSSQVPLTITTSRGQTYSITLADGTRVWLNSATTLTFPSSFANAKNREVTLNGEAYFIVEHKAAQPFRVKSGNQVVEDLGTEFNINSYTDEETLKTTLVEGSARVATLAPATSGPDQTYIESGSVVLKPSEQAIVSGNSMTKRQVDIRTAVDWKNGKFVFSDEPLKDIMRRVSRWYDVTVEYQGVDPEERFGGSVSRFENVSKVLDKLEQTGGLHFEINHKKIIVTK